MQIPTPQALTVGGVGYFFVRKHRRIPAVPFPIRLTFGVCLPIFQKNMFLSKFSSPPFSSNCTKSFPPLNSTPFSCYYPPKNRGTTQGRQMRPYNKEEKPPKSPPFRRVFVIFLSEILIIFCQSPPRGKNRKNGGQKVCLVLKQKNFSKLLKNFRHFDIIHGE